MNCMMQQCVYIVLLLIGRDFKCSCAQIHRPIQTHLEYIVSRNETIYMSNGYFTPDANGYLGEGNYWIAWQGTFSANNCERPIAMKFGIDRKAYYREYEIVAALKSAYNETAENYRIPSLYSHGFALERYWAMGTTLCDETIEQAISIYGPLSAANILRVFYHAVAALDRVHHYGVIHQDVEPSNFVFNYRRNTVFIIDFNLSVLKKNRNIFGENRIFCSISRHLKILESYMDDMKSLFYVMLRYAGLTLLWEDTTYYYSDDLQMARAKNQFKIIRRLCEQTGPPAVQRVFKQFYDDVMVDAKHISSVTADTRRPNVKAMKKYILDGIELITGARSPDFLWDADEKNVRQNRIKKRKTIRNSKPVKQSSRKVLLQTIPILPNIHEPVPATSPKPIVIADDTCTFDSMFFLFAALYIDNAKIAKRIKDSDKMFDEFVVAALSTSKMSKRVDKRGKALSKMFRERVVPQGFNVDGMSLIMPLAEMVEVLTKHSDMIYSANEYSVCKKCNNKIKDRTHLYLPLDNMSNWQYFIKNLQACVDKIDWTFDHVRKNCKCGMQMELKIKFNSIVLINLWPQYPYPYNDPVVYPYPMDKNQITKQIQLDGKKYDFRGAIEARGPHAVAHVIRNNGQWETYDDLVPTIAETPIAFTSNLYVYAISG